MRAFFSFRLLVFTALTCAFLLPGVSCRHPSRVETEQARRQQQTEEREKQLAFLSEDGEVDWRKRVQAASDALDQAKSDRRWGRSERSLKNALKAANLMPPTSKDFDGPLPKQTDGAAANGKPAEEGVTGDSPSTDDTKHEQQSTSEAQQNGGAPVTNAEVQTLRESLETLFKALDGKAGTSNSGLSFERDAIEIR